MTKRYIAVIIVRHDLRDQLTRDLCASYRRYFRKGLNMEVEPSVSSDMNDTLWFWVPDNHVLATSSLGYEMRAYARGWLDRTRELSR